MPLLTPIFLHSDGLGGEAGELPYFKPSKLLSLLKAPESDLENGWVVLETRTNSPEAADRI